MTQEEYTNLDLDTAEELLITAGKPELAKALRYQAQGVRNLVQGEWGLAFVGALESISKANTERILAEVATRLDEITSYVQQSVTIGRESKEIALRSEKTALESLAVSKAGAAKLATLEKAVLVLKKGQTAFDQQTKQLTVDIAAHATQLAAHDQRIARTEQAVRQFMEWRARLDEWRKQLDGQ